MIVLGVVFTVFFGLVAVLLLGQGISDIRKWKRRVSEGIDKDSGTSCDFKESFRQMHDFLRKDADGDVHLLDKDNDYRYVLDESSEIASLIRYAHFAGCHIWIERIPEDAEMAEEEDSFVTDLKKAAETREERKWSRYRRS